MEVSLYNTLTNRKEVLIPISAKQIKIYVCGVTVYDYCHLGHARGSINFDVLIRFLRHIGYHVLYVKNFTDIDDKIIKRVKEEKLKINELTESMIEEHNKDMKELFVEAPDITPRATKNLDEMIRMIQMLIDKNYAYSNEQDVFFRVKKATSYGKLSGEKLEELKAGYRVEINKKKENQLDFVLWKKSNPDEPGWDSPWGRGRPGWHIECSSMCKTFLGTTIDIHGGGMDLIFPHHENEIAQSEAVYEKPLANYWLHNGLVEIQGEKMSKSLGNYARIRDLTRNYHPEVIRFLVLQCHYRHALCYSEKAICLAATNLDKIYFVMARFLEKYPYYKFDEFKTMPDPSDDFLQALADDINTPQAIASLFQLVKKLNQNLEDEETALMEFRRIISNTKILGILNVHPIDWFHSPRINKNDCQINKQAVENYIQQRQKAREENNWELADTVRKKLFEKGIELKDEAEDTFWFFK